MLGRNLSHVDLKRNIRHRYLLYITTSADHEPNNKHTYIIPQSLNEFPFSFSLTQKINWMSSDIVSIASYIDVHIIHNV